MHLYIYISIYRQLCLCDSMVYFQMIFGSGFQEIEGKAQELRTSCCFLWCLEAVDLVDPATGGPKQYGVCI